MASKAVGAPLLALSLAAFGRKTKVSVSLLMGLQWNTEKIIGLYRFERRLSIYCNH